MSTWLITGATERAVGTFSDDGRTRTHHGDFTPDGEWTTLRDRVASRVD